MRITEPRTTGHKYYATDLEIELQDGRMVSIHLASDDPEPSQVALVDWDSREEFDREQSDGHYEREATRIVVDAIFAALNRTSAYEGGQS